MKTLRSQTEASQVNLAHKAQEMEQRPQGIRDQIEEIDTLVKDVVKSK